MYRVGQKVVRVCLYTLMENPKWTFGPTQRGTHALPGSRTFVRLQLPITRGSGQPPPGNSSSFLPPFVSLIRTMRPSCSWPSWRAGMTVRMLRGSSITWGPRNWWVGRLSPWPWHGAAAELRGCQGRVSTSWSFLHDASNQKHKENIWFGPLARAGRWPLYGVGGLCLQHSPQGEPPQAVLLGEGSTRRGVGAWSSSTAQPFPGSPWCLSERHFPERKRMVLAGPEGY